MRGTSAQDAVDRANKLTSAQLTSANRAAAATQQDAFYVNGLHLTTSTLFAAEVDKALRSAIMDLCEMNMKQLYEATPGGWNRRDKEEELFDSSARFIVLHERGNVQPVAFVNWRFDVEECDEEDACARRDEDVIEVAYCYELQVNADFRRHGFGRLLIEQLELLARHARMRKVMLTVFVENVEAMSFYKRIGFSIDRISPSQFEDDDNDNDDDLNAAETTMGRYEIMSKAM